MMKKVVKKLFVIAVVASVAVTAMPTISVNAEVSYPKTYATYRSTTKEFDSGHRITVSGLTKDAKIYPAKMKTSKKSVMIPWYMAKGGSDYYWSTTYVDGDGKVTGEPYESKYDDFSVEVGFRILKAGTANLSYKINDETYKTKITAYKYKNPIKTAQIAGIKNGSSTNLASKLKTQNYSRMKMSAKKNNATVKMVANSGWKITGVDVHNRTTGVSYSINNGSKGAGSAKLNIGNVKKTDELAVYVYTYNTSTGLVQNCGFYINN